MRRRWLVGVIALALFIVGVLPTPILLSRLGFSRTTTAVVSMWVALGFLPVCAWYYGRADAARGRRTPIEASRRNGVLGAAIGFILFGVVGLFTVPVFGSMLILCGLGVGSIYCMGASQS